MLPTLLQYCIVIVMQIKLTVVVVVSRSHMIDLTSVPFKEHPFLQDIVYGSSKLSVSNSPFSIK